MDELRTMLEAIEDSYVDFVEAMVHYASKKPSEQKDFWEDAAYMDAC